MDYRKLISFGNSSYVISLPKPWLNKHGLKKGDNICLKINEKDIVLYPKDAEEHIEEVKITIDIDGLDLDVIARKINSAYINGADIIKITGTEINEKAREIKRMIQNLMAMETISQTTKSIVSRSFLNMKEVDVNNLLRRADHVISTMFKAIEEISEKQGKEVEEIYESVNQRDGDVNRICFLIFRALNHHIKNPKNMSLNDPVKLWGITFFIEEVGDELKRIARKIPSLDKKLTKEFVKIIDQVSDIYNEAMKAFYTNDVDAVYEISTRRKPLMDKCDKLLEKEFKNPVMVNLTDKTKNLLDKIHNLNRLSY